MDGDTLRSLHALPLDLQECGWELSPMPGGQSTRRNDPHGTTYRVVYQRPFEHGVDVQAMGVVIDYALIRVEAQSRASWAAAREDAILAMREIDARRQR